MAAVRSVSEGALKGKCEMKRMSERETLTLI